jgi:hypothetical protein
VLLHVLALVVGLVHSHVSIAAGPCSLGVVSDIASLCSRTRPATGQGY